MTLPRIFIPTKNRAETIQTHRYFKGYNYWVLVHNQQQWDTYMKFSEKTGIEEARLLITNTKDDQFGLTRQREWACNTANRDEWFVFADDNIKEIQAVSEPQYHSDVLPVQADPGLRTIFEKRCEPERFLTDVFNECVSKAEEYGVCHVGFAVVDNFFFRGRHWKEIGYIIGKLMVWKNTNQLVFDHAITMEDFELTAQSLLKFGWAIVNNFVYPLAGHYQKGGMGTRTERASDRQRDVKLLMDKYPGLLLSKTRTDGNPDVSLTMYRKDAVEKWRKGMQVKANMKGMWK